MIEIGMRRWFFERARTVLVITAASLSIDHDRRRIETSINMDIVKLSFVKKKLREPLRHESQPSG